MSETKTTVTSETKRGTNYSHYNGGTLEHWSQHKMVHPRVGKVRGKHFLKDHLDFTAAKFLSTLCRLALRFHSLISTKKTKRSTSSSREAGRC